MTLEVTFLGRCSGKSALLLRKLCGHFVDYNEPTIEDTFNTSIDVDGETTQLKILDTAGLSESYNCFYSCIRSSKVLVFVISVADLVTFQDVDSFISVSGQEISDKALILVGNMADMVERRVISTDEAEMYARGHGMKYIETSAKTGQNVDELFKLIVREYRIMMMNEPPPPPLSQRVERAWELRRSSWRERRERRERHYQETGEGLCTVF